MAESDVATKRSRYIGNEGANQPSAADCTQRPLSGSRRAGTGPPAGETHVVAKSAEPSKAGTSGGGGFLLHLVRDIRQGRVAGADLSRDDRRACVKYFTAEGFSAAEIAVAMNVTDRTIRRDRQAIRSAHIVKPGQALGDQVISEFYAQADWAVARLRRAVRDTGDGRVTPHMRMRAEINAFRIHRELVALLAKLKYIPTGQAQLNAEAMTHRCSEEDLIIDMVLGRSRSR